MHGDIRLAGGQTTNEGRVEICISNQWSTVCGYLALGDVYGWTLSEALVTCKQLGFDGTIIVVIYLVTRIVARCVGVSKAPTVHKCHIGNSRAI